MDTPSLLDKVFTSFSGHAEVLMQIQLAKAEFSGSPFDVRSYQRLRKMILGEWEWKDHPSLTGQPETAIVKRIAGDLDKIIGVAPRLARLMFRKAIHTTKEETDMYFLLWERGGMARESMAGAYSIFSALVKKGLAQEFGGTILAIPLRNFGGEYGQLRDFLEFLDILPEFRSALSRPVINLVVVRKKYGKDLLTILEEEAAALAKDGQYGDYRAFMRSYESEKMYCYALFKKIQWKIPDQVALAHSIDMAFIKYLHPALKKRSGMYLARIIAYMLPKSVLVRRLYLSVRTAYSGLTEIPPSDGTLISQEEKDIVFGICREIMRNPLAYFVPSQQVQFSFSGGVLSFRTAYRDRFQGKVLRSKDVVYGNCLEALKSQRAMVILQAKGAPSRLNYGIQYELRERGISSISLIMPEHEMRQTMKRPPLAPEVQEHEKVHPHVLESLDPIYSASMYGAIEQVVQGAQDIYCAVDWLVSRGHKHVGVMGVSTSITWPQILLACHPYVTTGVWATPAPDAADIIWHSPITLHIRQMYESAGVSLQELQRAWACTGANFTFSLIPESKKKVSSGLVLVSTKDSVVPLDQQEYFAKRKVGMLGFSQIKRLRANHHNIVARILVDPRLIASFVDKRLGKVPERSPLKEAAFWLGSMVTGERLRTT